MSSKIIEVWLNETLLDSTHLDIPGLILKPENKKPLTRYGIDRDQMLVGKISNDQIDRIYRALFVYSLGFYEMLSKTLVNSPNKNTFQSSIWKVFSILLEYCCKTNYQNLVNKIQAEHRKEIEEQEEKFNENEARMFKIEKDLQKRLDDLTKERDILQQRLDDALFEKSKMDEEMEEKTKTHESEVTLRLQFEAKLNSLHALHRDLTAKYNRAVEDIFNLEILNKDQAEQIEEHKVELIDLRAKRIEHEAKIQFQEEQIKHKNNDNEIKLKQIKDNE